MCHSSDPRSSRERTGFQFDDNDEASTPSSTPKITMTNGMRMRTAALLVVFIAVSMRWSVAYPDCTQHPSCYTGASKYDYNGTGILGEEL
jgi:hypothetical protein